MVTVQDYNRLVDEYNACRDIVEKDIKELDEAKAAVLASQRDDLKKMAKTGGAGFVIGVIFSILLIIAL